MSVVRDSRSLLQQALERPQIDLLQAALAMAVDEYPALDLSDPLRQIEGLAAEVQDLLPMGAKPEGRLRALANVLGEVHGFTGNAREYADPKNSYLNEVLARRVGIPISLSLVYTEVARRAGISLYPVAFPGHFLVALQDGASRWVLDPFQRGKILKVEELRELLARSAPGLALSPAMIRPALPKQVIFRMLSNLKHLYLGAEDFPRAFRTVELLLVVAPEHPGELRARSSVLQSLGAFQAALDDVQQCMVLSPHAPDAAALRWRAQVLASRASWRN